VDVPMSAAAGVAVAVTFVWSGMVLAISFIETPLKFRAPDVTLQIGLGIGRLVFRALNAAEIILALVLLGAAVAEPPPRSVVVTGTVAILALVVQLAAVRPRLTRRSDRVLAGAEVPRSHAHYGYVGLELVKLAALVATGTLLLSQ
jgi:hypothetical protein